MRHHHMILTAGAALASASAIAAQADPPITLRAVTDCRAGCQGGEGNCQESTQSAVFNASFGYHLVPSSRTLVRHWNASDSPGLRGEPVWLTDPDPLSARPSQITVRPDVRTCIGRSPDTQGVTFYEFQYRQERD